MKGIMQIWLKQLPTLCNLARHCTNAGPKPGELLKTDYKNTALAADPVRWLETDARNLSRGLLHQLRRQTHAGVGYFWRL